MSPRTLLLPLLAVLSFSGCTLQRGEILGSSPLDYQDVSFLTPRQDEYFWIAPPRLGPHDVQPVSMQLPPAGVWVREGWIMVEFQCFTPRDRPAVNDPILPETQDDKALYLHAGHRYRLSCSPMRIGDVVLEDLGPSGR
jgi:uncharacterized membrane protein YqaE (UPF0057 family)